MKSCKSTLTNPHLLRAKEMKSYSYSLFDFTCSVSIMNTVYLLPFSLMKFEAVFGHHFS